MHLLLLTAGLLPWFLGQKKARYYLYYLERRSDTHLQTIISVQAPVVPPGYNEESHGTDWRLVSQCYPSFFSPR